MTGFALFTVDFDPGDTRDEVGGMEHFLMEMVPSLDLDTFRMTVNFTRRALVEIRKRERAWDVLVDLVESDVMELGSHTVTHPSFTGQYTGTEPLGLFQEYIEIRDQANFVEEVFDIFPRAFRSPFFNHSRRTLDLLSKVGVWYDTSSYVPDGTLPPPFAYRTPTTYGSIIRAITTLKIDPDPWTEPIARCSDEALSGELYAHHASTGESIPAPLHTVIAHPWEFHESHPHQREIKGAFEGLLDSDYELIRMEELESEDMVIDEPDPVTMQGVNMLDR